MSCVTVANSRVDLVSYSEVLIKGRGRQKGKENYTLVKQSTSAAKVIERRGDLKLKGRFCIYIFIT